MKRENETCIQHIKVSLPFHPKKAADPNQAGKCRRMIELLQKTNVNWKIHRTQNLIVLETTDLDFNRLTEFLSKNGIGETDYDLSVEYERKWGLL